MLALADILARFAPATRVGPGKYRTVCPVHGGGSLVITQGDTSVLFKCWAMDCPLEALLAAAGLAMADISPTRSAASLPTGYVAIHDYRDAMGTLRYQVLQERTPPSAKKKFKQRRPSANGSEAWIWNLDGIERLPFRLPDLVGHSLVWIVEGEKDVNRLWQLGLPATCNSGGTGGGWPLTLSRALLAIGVQRAIILQDADRPGATHAALVAQALERAGIHTRLLPP